MAISPLDNTLIHVYYTCYFKAVSHLGADLVRHWLAAVIVLEPVFQSDMSISRLDHKLIQDYCTLHFLAVSHLGTELVRHCLTSVIV